MADAKLACIYRNVPAYSKFLNLDLNFTVSRPAEKYYYLCFIDYTDKNVPLFSDLFSAKTNTIAKRLGSYLNASILVSFLQFCFLNTFHRG